MSIDETLAARVAQARRQARRTFRELAAASGASVLRLRELEHGLMPGDLTVRQLESLGRALGVSPAFLLGAPTTAQTPSPASQQAFAALMINGHADETELRDRHGEQAARDAVDLVVDVVGQLGAQVVLDEGLLHLRLSAVEEVTDPAVTFSPGMLGVLHRIWREGPLDPEAVGDSALAGLIELGMVCEGEELCLPTWLQSDLGLDRPPPRVSPAASRVRDASQLPAGWLVGQAENTRRNYRAAIGVAERFLAERDVRLTDAGRADLQAYIDARMSTGEPSASTRLHVAVLRSFYGHLAEQSGGVSVAARLRQPVRPGRKSKPLTDLEADRLISACLSGGGRAAVAVLLLASTEVKVETLVGLSGTRVEVGPPTRVTANGLQGTLDLIVHPAVANRVQQHLEASASEWLFGAQDPRRPISRGSLGREVRDLVRRHGPRDGSANHLKATDRDLFWRCLIRSAADPKVLLYEGPSDEVD